MLPFLIDLECFSFVPRLIGYWHVGGTTIDVDAADADVGGLQWLRRGYLLPVIRTALLAVCSKISSDLT